MEETKKLPMERPERILALVLLASSALLCNALLYAGLNLAFAVGALGIFGGSWWYLSRRGFRADPWAKAAAGLCAAILAAYPRSDDSVLKFCLLAVLCTVPGMLLCQRTGKNRRSPDSALSLLDGPRALFTFGLGRMGEATRGMAAACKTTGPLGRKGGSVLLGLVIGVPVLALLIPLLVFADAAFEGLIDRLPEIQVGEGVTTAIFAIPAAWVLYARGAALAHAQVETQPEKPRRGLNAITVNTVLVLVALVYGVFLVTQLAYFVGGFAGILPEGYTLAQYARRGFFEMGLLCALNLGIIALAIHLVRGATPGSTRLLCLFLGLVTLFLVAASSAKIFLYIRSFGLTRLRVLTEVFLLWLGATVVFVTVWLFRPQFSYMKPSLLLGLALSAALLWADVDTVVAGYNVRAYQKGRLETVDVSHLSNLSFSAVPYLEELTRDSDPEIAQMAQDVLERKARYWWHRDFRSWNLSAGRAGDLLEPYRKAPIAAIEEAETVDSQWMELIGTLDGRTYTFDIYHDGNFNILSAGGDAHILSSMDTQLGTDALEMAAALQSWFEAQGGQLTTLYH